MTEHHEQGPPERPDDGWDLPHAPKHEPHEVAISIACNEEDEEDQHLEGRGSLLVLFGEDGDARRSQAYLHAVSYVDLWGAAELIRRIADEMFEDYMDDRGARPDGGGESGGEA